MSRRSSADPGARRLRDVRGVQVAASQPRDRVGDIEGTIGTVVRHLREAQAAGAVLVCFPECYLQGYVVDPAVTPDLAITTDSAPFSRLLQATADTSPVVVIGFIEDDDGVLFNSAAVLRHGRLVGIYRKAYLLPGEAEVFRPGTDTPIFHAAPLRFGINICNDLNFPDAAARVAAQDVDLLVCPCNNMLREQRAAEWKDKHNPIRGERCRETELPLLSSDVTGRREGRVAWGPTALLGSDGQVIEQAPLDHQGILISTLP